MLGCGGPRDRERPRVRSDGEFFGRGGKGSERETGKKMEAKCAVVKLNGTEGESPSGPAESRRSLERKN